MLAIVEHQQRRLAVEARSEALLERLPGLLAHSERLRHGARHLPRIRQRSQIGEPHAAGGLLEQAGHEPEGQARLAVSARAGQRQEPGLAEQAIAFLELLLAAHEARYLARQVVERAGSRHQLGSDPGDLLLQQRAQAAPHFVHRREPAIRVLLEAALDQVPVARSDFLRQLAPLGLAVQDLGPQERQLLRIEGLRSGQALEQDAAHREHVGASVLRQRQHLLGAHVAGRAHDDAGLTVAVIVGAGALGEAEVEDLHATAGRDHDVARLEIAMDHAALVRRFERVHDLLADVRGVVRRQRSARDAIGQRLALDPLEDQVAGFVPGLLEAMDGGDVGMVERGEQLGFALEAGELLGIARDLGGQRLDRNEPIELAIAGEVDHAHATAAELAFDDVVAEFPRRNAGCVRGFSIQAH